jgi:hypothetical protein
VSRTSGKSEFRSMVPSKMLQGLASKPSIYQQWDYQISRISVHARLAHGQTPSMNLFYSQKKGPAEVFLFSCKIVIKI